MLQPLLVQTPLVATTHGSLWAVWLAVTRLPIAEPMNVDAEPDPHAGQEEFLQEPFV